jgi:IS605 OrfB family transposase
VIAAGIATGATCEEAECVALEELIERDAVTVAWLAGEQLERVVIPDQMTALFAGPAANLETTIIYFPNPYQLPVLGALVYDRKTDLVTLGTACRPHPLDAMLKAYAEAAQLQMLAYALDDPNSPLLQAIQRTPNSPLKPWRADRCYSQSYRSDWRDVTDLLCQIQLYLDPSMKAHLDEHLRNATLRTFDQLPKGRSRERTDYLECLRAVPTPLLAVDVTTADVAACGLWVVRVIAPGLCTNTPAAFPLLGNQRLQSLQKLHPKRPPLPYRLIVVEDLNVRGLARTRLAKSILDAGWSTFLTILTDKAASAGGQVIRINPRFTTQTCSNCGELVPKSLSVRTHICPSCGYVADRDENAAINMLRAGAPPSGTVADRSPDEPRSPIL